MKDLEESESIDKLEKTPSIEVPGHVEVSPNFSMPVDEELSYGQGGLKGIVRSPYVFGAALLASLGGFSFGYDQGVISLILVMPQFHDQYPQTRPGSPGYGFNVGFMTGMLELGAFIGCLFYPKLTDRISRKWGLTCAVGVFCVGAIIQTAAMDYGTLVAGRFIGGMGVGTLAMGAPLYISEISPPDLRGSLLTLEQMSIVIGGIVSYWITYGTRTMPNTWSFRLPFLLQMVSAGSLGIFIHFFPYSPRWLAMRGRDEESLQSLVKLRVLPVDDHRVQREWKEILAEVRIQNEIEAREYPNSSGWALEFRGWVDLFKKKYIRRTIVAIGIPFFQQFSGINAFVYYAPTFFAALGQNYEMSLILSGMINICQFVAVLPVLIYLDQIGRRTLAIWGGVAMALPFLIMAGIVGKYSTSWATNQGPAWIGVALVYFYVLMYGASYGPLGWVMPAEVFPNSRRAKGVGIATSTIWLSNFVIGVAVPPMLISIGYGTFIFFGVFCMLAAIFAYFFVPETSGKTLEEMDRVFNDNLAQEESDIVRQVMNSSSPDTSQKLSV